MASKTSNDKRNKKTRSGYFRVATLTGETDEESVEILAYVFEAKIERYEERAMSWGKLNIQKLQTEQILLNKIQKVMVTLLNQGRQDQLS